MVIMTDNELLLAMSDILDKKLNPINDQLGIIKTTVECEILPRLDKIETRLDKIEVNQENEILSRLNTIESCYTSTYKRYKTGADQIDKIQSDLEVVKDVVREHSKKLKKIS